MPGMYRGRGGGRSGSDELNGSDDLDIVLSWEGGGCAFKRRSFEESSRVAKRIAENFQPQIGSRNYDESTAMGHKA